MPELPWALKAAALLWPTPLRAFDPHGEDGRWADLCGRLPWLVELGKPSRALLHAAAEAAEGAEAAAQAPGVNDGSAPLERLVPNHPLGDRRLKVPVQGGAAVEWHAAAAAWSERVDRVAPLASPTDKASYSAFWWAWTAPEAKPALLDGISGDTVLRDYPAMRRANLAAALVPTLAQGAAALPELVVLQIGPVQSFIEASRRTHDLWSGSMFIAWFTLHAAKAVAEALGPDSMLSPDLRWHPLARVIAKVGAPSADERRTLLTAANSNKLQFLCPSERVDEVARGALEAAAGEWRRIGEHVRSHLNAIGGVHTPNWDKSFSEQIDDLLTFSVVSVPWSADALDEAGWPAPAAASERRPSALPARFGDLVGRGAVASAAARASAVPPPWPGDGRPKCAVDGEREQMGPLERTAEFWRALREARPDAAGEGLGLPLLQIGPAEGLSAVSLARRFAAEAYFGVPGTSAVSVDRRKSTEQAALRFPSNRSIAAAPFRKLALQCANTALIEWERAVDALTRTLGFEAPGNLIPGLGPVGQSGFRQDGDWLFDSRYEQGVLDREYGSAATAEAQRLAAVARERLSELHQAMGTSAEGQPTPYYAILMMDVDSLGQALTGRHPLFRDEAGGHRRALYPTVHAAISERLARLAVVDLPKVVHEHLGRVIYCGGDDLLAILPLHTALRCAGRLRAAVQDTGALGSALSVSVGIGVGHSLTPMHAVIEAARRAERRAKSPIENNDSVHGDHLGVDVVLRSGRPFGLAMPWLPPGTDGAVNLIEALIDSRFGGSEAAPRLNALPKFEAELVAMIGPPPIQAGGAWNEPAGPHVLHRLGVHLGWLESDGGHDASLTRLLAHRPGGPSGPMAPSPAHLVALLRLARFLRRELPTADLNVLLGNILPAGGAA